MELTVFESGSKKAKENIIMRFCTRYYLSQMSNGNIKCVSKDPKWFDIHEYVSNMKGPDKGHFLITINPPHDDLESLQKVVKRIRSYKNFLGPMTYCYEVRGRMSVDDDKSYTGLHVHIFADDEAGCPLSDVRKRCRAASEQVYKKSINPKSTDVILCTSDTIKYIKGEKKDPDKQIGLYYTERYRRENNLEDVYYAEPLH